MLTLSLKPGEYVDIGDNVRFVFTGGTVRNVHILVDAPKTKAVFRSDAPEKYKNPGMPSSKRMGTIYSADDDLEERIERIFDGC